MGGLGRTIRPDVTMDRPKLLGRTWRMNPFSREFATSGLDPLPSPIFTDLFLKQYVKFRMFYSVQ